MAMKARDLLTVVSVALAASASMELFLRRVLPGPSPESASRQAGAEPLAECGGADVVALPSAQIYQLGINEGLRRAHGARRN